MSYSIVRFQNEQLEIMATFKSYDAADDALDSWCDKLPHAWLEIVNTAEAKALQ